jgi:DNA-binding transcriptional ArsR family regulator
MPSPLVPDDQIEAVARRFRMLGEPVRLELLGILHDEGRLSVGELVEATGHRQANVSKHLGRMADEGLLTRTREGVHVYYALDDTTLPALCLLVATRLQDEE